MRAHLNKAIIRKVSGTPADGSVQVYEPGGTTPLVQTMYVGDTGVTARANPFTFATGVIEFYLDTPQRVKLVITPTGGSAQTFDNVDVPFISDPADDADISTSAPGDAPAAGVIGELAGATHRHGREAWGTSGNISTSVPGDTVVAGASGKTADAGHRHAREAFGGSADITMSKPGDNTVVGATGKTADAGHKHKREPRNRHSFLLMGA